MVVCACVCVCVRVYACVCVCMYVCSNTCACVRDTPAPGKTHFIASCGPPPADLSNLHSRITSLPSTQVSSSNINGNPVLCEGCEWVTVQRGPNTNTVVALKIAQTLKPFVATDYPASIDAGASKVPSASLPPPQLPQSSASSSSSSSLSASSDPSSDSEAAHQQIVAEAHAQSNGAQDLLNSSRPKNIFSGFSSAVKCIGAGFVAGGVAMAAAPTVGYKENGVRGLVGGIFQGVLGGAALAAAGVVAGGAQVVRGVVNTPEAMKQGLKKNMKWDNEMGAWVENTVMIVLRHCFL